MGTAFEPTTAVHDAVQGGLSEAEKRENVIRLVFGGDPARFETFCEVIRAGIPDGICVVLRGSAVTGRRWNDGAPFHADGPGTSHLDLTLIGDAIIGFYTGSASLSLLDQSYLTLIDKDACGS